MLKKKLLDQLNAKLKELLIAHNINTPIVVENYVEDIAVIYVPKEVANTRAEEFMAIYKELCSSVEGAKIDPACIDKYPMGTLRGIETWELDIYAKRGYFTVNSKDEKFYDEMYDDDCCEKKEKERQEAIRKHWKEYIYPIPKPAKNAKDELYLTMAYEPYDQIKNGEKTTEFRRYTPSYVKRILAHPPTTVRLQRGYGGPGHDFPEQMVWKVKKISLYDHLTRQEMDPWNLPKENGFAPTFIAIDLAERVA